MSTYHGVNVRFNSFLNVKVVVATFLVGPSDGPSFLALLDTQRGGRGEAAQTLTCVAAPRLRPLVGLVPPLPLTDDVCYRRLNCI